ncbi:hypothetical protein OUZ56_029722 [Daphnia magna]|uniref:Uncharacterized protein n=1 Tax=Daphnia magna TaxID=35525 RepID=A0ABR0B7N1_9CRUS|nr:hypothetical protein OUZ56_029722 [Daphnia magna]
MTYEAFAVQPASKHFKRISTWKKNWPENEFLCSATCLIRQTKIHYDFDNFNKGNSNDSSDTHYGRWNITQCSPSDVRQMSGSDVEYIFLISSGQPDIRFGCPMDVVREKFEVNPLPRRNF